MRIAFSGHRPNKIYGYDIDLEEYIGLRNILRETLNNLIVNEGANEFWSGGALGWDTITFQEVYWLKYDFKYDIKNNLAIPFLNQDCKWNKENVDTYLLMKDYADEKIYVDTLDNYKVNGLEEDCYHPAKMQKRNEFMVDNCDILISCWNGDKKGGTYNCIKYAKSKGVKVLNINPNTLEVEYLKTNLK